LELRLENNKIDDDGMIEFRKGLTPLKNLSLLTVDLENNNIEYSDFGLIKNYLE